MAHRALVYGGKGALGSTLVRMFKRRGNWTTISVDLDTNEEATHNVVIPATIPWSDQAKFVNMEVSKMLQDQKFDAVVCVAGGWAGGNMQSKDVIETTDLMWKVSVQTAILSAQIAANCLKDGGLLLLPGSAAATSPTPGMIGYGIAKAAVHHLVRSLAQHKDAGLPNCCVTGIMPVVLDTQMNRKAMPNADYSSWTNIEELSNKIIDWSLGQDRPRNGSLVRVITQNYKTMYHEE